MVPAALLLLTSATLFSKNFCRPVFSPSMNDNQVTRLAKIMVVVIAAVALYFAIYSSPTLVSLLLLGYAGVTQFFPGVMLGLYWKRATKTGVFTGMITGVVLVAALMFGKRDPFLGLNAGFFSLCVNFVVSVLVSLFTPAERNGFDEEIEEDMKNAGFDHQPL